MGGTETFHYVLVALVMGLVFWLLNFLSQFLLEGWKKKNGHSLGFQQCYENVLATKAEAERAMEKLTGLVDEVEATKELVFSVRNRFEKSESFYRETLGRVEKALVACKDQTEKHDRDMHDLLNKLLLTNQNNQTR